MKCAACGYEDEEWNEEKQQNVKKLFGEFKEFEVTGGVETGDYHRTTEHRTLTLYICPECGTVKIPNMY